MDNATKTAKVYKYMKQLKNDEMRYKALEKLGQIAMNVQLLAETKVGKAVNKWACDDQCGELASDIIEGWKSLARKAGYEESKRRGSSESPETTPPPPKKTKTREPESIKEESPKKSKKSEKKHIIVPSNDFLAKLSAADDMAIKPKQHKLQFTAADLDTNYRPFPTVKPREKTAQVQEEDDQSSSQVEILKYRSHERSRVFAGKKKKNSAPTKVDSLFNLTLRFIGNNVDLIDDTGDIPFDILRPALERCSPERLNEIENRNPFLAEDSDCLWEKHFKLKFANERPKSNESWKHAYWRIMRQKTRDDNDKLARLSEKLNGQHVAVTSSGRQAILADAKAPLNMRKRQISNHIAYSTKPIPSALDLSKARKEIYNSGNTSALRSMPSVVNNLGSGSGGHRMKKEPPKKKGALMIKTLKMLNMKRK